MMLSEETKGDDVSSAADKAVAAGMVPLPVPAADDPPPTAEENAASLQWLRDRGVEVETQEDREKERGLLKSMQGLSADAPDTRTFTYVSLPVREGDAPALCTAVAYADERGSGDQLPRILKAHFAAGEVDAEALRRSAANHLGNVAAGQASSSVKPETIAKMGASVESFRIGDGIYLCVWERRAGREGEGAALYACVRMCAYVRVCACVCFVIVCACVYVCLCACVLACLCLCVVPGAESSSHDCPCPRLQHFPQVSRRGGGTEEASVEHPRLAPCRPVWVRGRSFLR